MPLIMEGVRGLVPMWRVPSTAAVPRDTPSILTADNVMVRQHTHTSELAYSLEFQPL